MGLFWAGREGEGERIQGQKGTRLALPPGRLVGFWPIWRSEGLEGEGWWGGWQHKTGCVLSGTRWLALRKSGWHSPLGSWLVLRRNTEEQPAGHQWREPWCRG